MCTIIALHNIHPTYPLVVAANRDEFTRRVATPPTALSTSPLVVGGRDRQALGTWLAVTPRGFFVALTNQRTWGMPDRSRRSRGELVIEAARLGSVDAVGALLRSQPARRYNPFNLLFGDATSLAAAYVRDDDPTVTVEPLGPGMHVLANDSIGSPWFPKVARPGERVALGAVAAMGLDEVFASLVGALGDHTIPAKIPPPPAGSLMPAMLARQLQAMCVHTPGYGTVSATLFAATAEGAARYLYADGPPCVTGFVEYTGLLR